MDNISELQKEEFIQCYQQYRWLDDTRTKYVDRFFIMLLAVLGGRLQFDSFFQNNKFWLILLYAGFSFIAVFITKSVLAFRRQQRGHGMYINAMRKKLLKSENDQFKDYSAYLNGRKVLLTTWIEFILVFIATLSPLSLIDAVRKSCVFSCQWLTIVFIIIMLIIEFVLVRWLMVPFFRYNFAQEIDWKRH